MLEGVAAAARKVLGTLKKHRELRNTYVVFTSDNGYLLGEHRLANTKAVPYEESVRVSLVVRGPGIPAGETRPHLVTNNDWAPTMADLAGLEGRDSWDGRSLRPLLNAEGRNVADWRAALLSEHPEGTYRPGHSIVRTQRYSYIEWSTGETELYDLSTDPYQLENLAGERPEEETVLKARLEASEPAQEARAE